ncbi:ribosome recycling factor [bacterium]|nr:ribosome recycling factor [bacterium]|tara:strand:- start:10235 stop:10786 length:552 start_codon:yes stop_codon:yes gene_type:complete
MSYDFSTFKKRLNEAKDWLLQELSRVRTGRATPALFDGVRVASYGAQVPINNIAGVTVEDARTIRIAPWEKDQIRAIESAIASANLGVSVIVDDQGVRVIFPELTAERRESLLKIVKSKHEDARVSVRTARDEVWEDIQKKERSGEIPEDDKFRLKDEMQENVDETNKSLDASVERKKKEISV